MKYFSILFVSILLLSLPVTAQIIITSDDFAAIGDEFVYENDTFAMDSGLLFSEEITGPPWDFSDIEVDEIDTVKFIDPSTTAFADTFPTANLCIYDTSGWAYLEKDNNIVQLLGIVVFMEDQQLVIPLNEPLTYMQFPVVYGLQFSDEQFTDFRSTPEDLGIDFTELGFPTNPDSVRFAITYSIEGEVDDYGTCATPYDEFETLREIHTDNISLKVYIYVFPFGWIADPVFEEAMETQTYRWLTNDLGYTVAEVAVHNDTILNKRVVQTEPPPNSVYSAENENISIYPTLATNAVTIALHQPRDARFELLDYKGQLIEKQSLNGLRQKQINVQQLPAGMYLLRICDTATGELILLQKIIVAN